MPSSWDKRAAVASACGLVAHAHGRDAEPELPVRVEGPERVGVDHPALADAVAAFDPGDHRQPHDAQLVIGTGAADGELVADADPELVSSLPTEGDLAECGRALTRQDPELELPPHRPDAGEVERGVAHADRDVAQQGQCGDVRVVLQLVDDLAGDGPAALARRQVERVALPSGILDEVVEAGGERPGGDEGGEQDDQAGDGRADGPGVTPMAGEGEAQAHGQPRPAQPQAGGVHQGGSAGTARPASTDEQHDADPRDQPGGQEDRPAEEDGRLDPEPGIGLQATHEARGEHDRRRRRPRPPPGHRRPGRAAPPVPASRPRSGPGSCPATRATRSARPTIGPGAWPTGPPRRGRRSRR